MKLIVGLGNPGLLYRNSRHNAGSRVISKLAAQEKVSLKKNSFTHSIEGKGVLGHERYILAQPLTYMNLSGRSIKALINRHHLAQEQLLVVCDDMDLEVGAIRLRAEGSSGGHNGLQSIIDSLASSAFARLRIGIGRPASGVDARDFVLEAFRRQEKTEFLQAIDEAAGCCRVWIEEGTKQAMNRFNRKRTAK